jgi:hypothetical protein
MLGLSITKVLNKTNRYVNNFGSNGSSGCTGTGGDNPNIGVCFFFFQSYMCEVLPYASRMSEDHAVLRTSFNVLPGVLRTWQVPGGKLPNMSIPLPIYRANCA